MKKLDAIRYHGFNQPTNATWSWGTTRGDGAVLLMCPRDDVKPGGERNTMRLWVAGASEGQPWHCLPGNDEREQHVRAIEAGAKGFVMLYDRTFTDKGVEKGTSYDDFLLTILRLEKSDDGKVSAICHRA